MGTICVVTLHIQVVHEPLNHNPPETLEFGVSHIQSGIYYKYTKISTRVGTIVDR